MAKLIELRDVYKIYSEGLESEVRALDGVSLTIDRGEFVAIVGQSGSGKSTMMNVLGCLDVPTYGEYLLEGTDVSELSDMQLSRIRNKEIGFIFQGYNLIQELDALENVTLPLIYQGVSVWDREDIAMEALARELGINPNTVSKAYQELENEGVLYSVAGKGSFVSPDVRSSGEVRRKALDEFTQAAGKAWQLGVRRQELSAVLDRICGKEEQ